MVRRDQIEPIISAGEGAEFLGCVARRLLLVSTRTAMIYGCTHEMSTAPHFVLNWMGRDGKCNSPKNAVRKLL